jgi:hypothetical protein
MRKRLRPVNRRPASAQSRAQRTPPSAARCTSRSRSTARGRWRVPARDREGRRRLPSRRLEPTDALAVVTFDDEVRLGLPLGLVGSTELALEQALHRIQAGGSPNLSGGWLKGVE